MKKLVLSISMFLIAATTFAQSEVVTDKYSAHFIGWLQEF